MSQTSRLRRRAPWPSTVHPSCSSRVGARCARKRSKPKFSELTNAQQIAVVGLGVVQVGLLLAAELDIQRRPRDQVTGRKVWWRLICLINFFGPLAYFRFGRKSVLPHEQPAEAMRDAYATSS